MGKSVPIIRIRPFLAFSQSRVLFSPGELLVAERFERGNIGHSGLPDDIPAHAAIAVCNKIPHPLDRPPLHTIGRRLTVLLREMASQFSDLEDAERDGALVVRVLVKDFKRSAIAENCLFDFCTVIPDVLDQATA